MAIKLSRISHVRSPCRIVPIARDILYVLLICLQASCSSIRPVVKIGLLAPFEGLYRRTGYEALAAMRVAIADAATAETQITQLDLLPLALDDGAEPAYARRAAQKLLSDASVRAVVGPLNPATLSNVRDVIPTNGPIWVAPFAIEPGTGQFADPHTATDWATGLVAAVADVARSQHAQRLVLAGDPSGWPQRSSAAWAKIAQLSVLLSDDVGVVVASDAVFWLGRPDSAVNYLANLRNHWPTVPFWLGPQGGDPVLHERIKLHGPIYWATWLGADYAQWTMQHTPATPMAYLVYQATRQALAVATGHAVPSSAINWRVTFFVIGEDGKSQLMQR